MLGRLQRDTSLFYFALHRESGLIKDDMLDGIDSVLDDPELIALVSQALGSERPRSRSTGRERIAADRVLRALVLKHVRQLSFRQLERELRANIAYRRFTHFDDDRIPRYSTFSRSFAALGPEVTAQIHGRVVAISIQDGTARGRVLRTDTTAVESNIHYPTDSALLDDGIRVITRVLKSVAGECEQGVVKVVDHARAAKLRVIEIHRAAKAKGEEVQGRLQGLYSKLTSMTRAVVNQAKMVVQGIDLGVLPVVGDVRRVVCAQAELRQFIPLVERVIAQTKARVFDGDTHFPEKVFSIFEPHTQIIRKGKAAKPNEFGRIVRIDEVENGIVSHYDVASGVPSDYQQWMPAVLQHKEIFGKAPKVATGDRGFQSASNEREAREAGVDKVALPARGRLSEARARFQKQRWFKQAQRWRAGIESRIATLKHRFGMERAVYKGDKGFQRHVGWSVIANNLVTIARARHIRMEQQDAEVLKAA
jgi:IS5 family transposase